MVSLDRIRVVWTGFSGAPGVSTFYMAAAPTHLTPLQNLFGNIAATIPDTVRIQVQGSGESIDVATGAITGTWTDTTPAVVPGADTGHYAAAVGASINWNTGTFLSGRQLRGRTFMVPMGASAFDTDGTLLTGFIATFTSAAAGFLTAEGTNFEVWQRPRPATPTWTDKHGKVHAAKVARVGGHAVVTGFNIPDKGAVLTSRRD